MSGGIYLLQHDGKLIEMSERSYDSEDLLQELLAKYPHLLAGDQIDNVSPRRWLLVMREAGVPDQEGAGGRWSVDHLFLDQDAIPTLVEVKRSTDTRIRREVVGQMLDYAANAVVYWPVESLRANFEMTCQTANRDPEDMFRECFGSNVDEESFWQSVKTNLHAGRIRMLFVADEIPDELRRVVEFLNSQMDPAEVLAVEIKQYVGENLKTLVPRVIGGTATAEQKKRTSRQTQQWDESSFMAELERKGGSDLVSVARQILDWVSPRVTRIWWGRGSTAGSFVPVFEWAGDKHQLFTIHTGWTGTAPGFETAFQYQANKPPFNDAEKRRDLLMRFNTIPGVSLPPDSIDRRPSIPLANLASQDALDKLFPVIEWYLDEVRKTPS